jgi:hypothetical protein
MLRLRAIAERQSLVEELHDELEALLLGRNGNAEEADESDIIAFHAHVQREKPEEPEQMQSNTHDEAWQQSLLALPAELEKTRGSLNGGLTRLERLLETNFL